MEAPFHVVTRIIPEMMRREADEMERSKRR
jgi:hypothetical protein